MTKNRYCEDDALNAEITRWAPGTLVDWQLEDLANRLGLIEPFLGAQVRETVLRGRVLSYGLSSCGYDVRPQRTFQVFADLYGKLVDPKNFDPKLLDAHEDVDYCDIPSNSYALMATMEYFRIPPWINVTCVGKSTYARCGIITPLTPGEPGWDGELTVEIGNATRSPVRVYSEEGICQLQFEKLSAIPKNPYRGKYQNQRGVQLALV